MVLPNRFKDLRESKTGIKDLRESKVSKACPVKGLSQDWEQLEALIWIPQTHWDLLIRV
jgi:hypothetical protein